MSLIRPLVASTDQARSHRRPGRFRGFVRDADRLREPVLVASTDGVGTKLALAVETGRLATIGVDLVAMCVDDLVCQGAEPLFFLDYQLWGHLDPDAVADVMTGVADGCRRAGCAILGGELADTAANWPRAKWTWPGSPSGSWKDRLLGPGRPTPPGGRRPRRAPLPGLRSNGYSLARGALLGRAGRGSRTRRGQAPAIHWLTNCYDRR